MAVYAFSSEDIALALRDLGANLIAGNTGDAGPTGSESFFVKTPAGGIDGRVGDACGEAECTLVQLDGVDLVEVESLSMNVLNPSTDDISGGSYIRIIRLGINWVVATGSGGGGTSQPTYQFKTTTAIGAGNPESGAVGDGSANLWTFSGTSFGIDSSALYDIINPWATTVSQDKMITAYQCHSDSSKYVLVQSECEESSEGGGDNGGGGSDPLGYCIDDSTGLITSNVLQSECSGSWSANEPVSGCCEIGGVNNENVAQSWCSDQGGTFTSGACVENNYDPCPENAKFTVASMTFADPGSSGCASTPWSFNLTGQLGQAYQTGCTKAWNAGGTISSSENPPGGNANCYGTAVYDSVSNSWAISGHVDYFNTATSGLTSIPFTGTAPHTGSDCASTLVTAAIQGGGGNYDQLCDFTDASELAGTITLQLVCN